MSAIFYPKKIKPSKQEIRKHLELARKRIRSSEILLKQKEYRDAVSRVYYAFFDAASALLLTEGLVAKTHAGLFTLFSLHFVKKGKIKAEFAKFFRRAKEAREEADYEIYKDFTREEVKKFIKTAKSFIQEIEKIVILMDERV